MIFFVDFRHVSVSYHTAKYHHDNDGTAYDDDAGHAKDVAGCFVFLFYFYLILNTTVYHNPTRAHRIRFNATTPFSTPPHCQPNRTFFNTAITTSHTFFNATAPFSTPLHHLQRHCTIFNPPHHFHPSRTIFNATAPFHPSHTFFNPTPPFITCL